MADLSELQKEVREVNELNGWFDTERPFSADIALLHSEVSEFFEALIRLGGADNEGEELADIFIRLLDTAERLGFTLTLGERHEVLIPSAQGVHYLISQAYEGFRNADEAATEGNLRAAAQMVSDVATRYHVDLLDEVRKKLERNRQRGYRHGGKVE